MPNILPNSALAATNHGRAVQVYYQGYNGRLRESSTTDGSSYGNAHDITPSGTPVQTFTPLAATSYDNGNERRVYYLTPDHMVQEYAFTNNRWIAGELNNLKHMTASYSQLAVVHFSDQFRVYTQRSSDNKIIELGRGGTNAWKVERELKEASPGSRLAASYIEGVVRLVYQGADLKTYEINSRDNWGHATEIAAAKAPPHAPLAMAGIYAGTQLRLYTQAPPDRDGATIEVLYNYSSAPNAWAPGSTLPKTAIPLSAAAACAFDISAGTSVRVFVQLTGTDIQELKYDDGGSGWKVGASVATA